VKFFLGNRIEIVFDFQFFVTVLVFTEMSGNPVVQVDADFEEVK
jgi:hypothetical protein